MSFRYFFAVGIAALILAQSAFAQDWLGYQRSNAEAGRLLADFIGSSNADSGSDVLEFNNFKAYFMEQAGPDGDKCFFGCSAGFSASGPNIKHVNFRLFLAHTAIAEAAVAKGRATDAVDNLFDASMLVEAWKAEMVEPPRAGDRSMDEYVASVKEVGASRYFRTWLFFQGCIGSSPGYNELAAHLDSISQSTLRLLSISQSDVLRLEKLRASLADLGTQP